jgi:hypothetical protein
MRHYYYILLQTVEELYCILYMFLLHEHTVNVKVSLQTNWEYGGCVTSIIFCYQIENWRSFVELVRLPVGCQDYWIVLPG